MQTSFSEEIKQLFTTSEFWEVFYAYVTVKEYGVKKSWIKEFASSKLLDFTWPSYDRVYALTFNKDGDILFLKG